MERKVWNNNDYKYKQYNNNKNNVAYKCKSRIRKVGVLNGDGESIWGKIQHWRVLNGEP